MSHLLRQLLSFFIAVALIFTPLQGALASLSVTAPSMLHAVSSMEKIQSHDMASMSASASQDRMQMAAMGDHQCEQCDTGNCCVGTHCLSGHCAACIIGLLPVVISTSAEFGQPVLVLPDSAHLQSLSETLFRPPRA